MDYWLDKIPKVLSIVSLAIAALAAWYALPLDEKIKALDAETKRLENARIEQDLEIKKLETTRELSIKLYGEVKDVLRSKDRTVKEEEAVRVLVDSLADDPFRWKLLQAIAVGANDPVVKEKAEVTANFFKEEEQVPVVASNPPPTPSASSKKPYSTIKVDFFYCKSKQESVVKSAFALKTADIIGRWRPRYLPDEINSRPGYNIHSNIIRFNADEKDAAEGLKNDLEAKLKSSILTQEIQYPTANYISVFFCSE